MCHAHVAGSQARYSAPLYPESLLATVASPFCRGRARASRIEIYDSLEFVQSIRRTKRANKRHFYCAEREREKNYHTCTRARASFTP